MACLDTSFLIDLAGGKYKARAWRKMAELSRRAEPLVTTRLNIAELYVGVARSDNPKQEEKALQAILNNFGVLEFDDRVAPLFGWITACLQQIGRPAGDMDVLIAATAMANGHNLITRNKRHFMNIPHLQVEEY